LRNDTEVLLLVQLYCDWLKLMIAEFDAVDVLIQQYIVKPGTFFMCERRLATIEFRLLHIPDIQDGGISNQEKLRFLTNI
jgi:hypothetical protein